LGWRNDTNALLAACDVLACPSRHEPLGNVVLEAWAQARAVVAAKAHGPAALIEDGKTGLLAPVDDADALAAGLRRVLETPTLSLDLAQGGFAAYQSSYTKAAVVRRYREFFEEACA
jgi:glycosyltransferase involved in cell wall biosynthesis